jgi:predicted phosphodiesterase
MRFLLITDTHGRLDNIDALAAETACDAVIHAGDLGFYDEQSAGRLSERELNLRIIHSELHDDEKRKALSLSADQKQGFVRERLPLSQLPQYLNGERQFTVPVYAVWGNHEDTEVVRKFYSGEYVVPNLHVLHDKSLLRADRCHILGIGGNLLMSRKFFQKPIAGGGGRVWTTLSQYLDLISVAESLESKSDIRILVSHVSPGKEAFVSLIGACVGASFIISGHMGPPFSMCWNEFAIREPEESTRRLEQSVAEVCAQSEQLDQTARESASRLKACLVRCQQETISMGRGLSAPRWYRDMFCVNLPDWNAGHAVLAVEQGSIHLETYAARDGWKANGEQADPPDKE